MTKTEARRQQAARFAEQLGVDPAALFAGAMAAWSNLNPQTVSFEQALSVAGVVLAADRTGDKTWRTCRWCHADITAQGPMPDWAAAETGRHPALFCPEARPPAGRLPLHEPVPGTGQRSYILAAAPELHGHGKTLMREVIETDPAGRRSVFAVVPDACALDILEALRHVSDYGRENLAAERYDIALTRAIETARALYARDEDRQCEDYARGQAALIAATFGRDIAEIEDAIGGGEMPGGVDNPRYFGLPVPVADEQIPAAPVRNTAVGLIGTLDHARKYTWSQQAEVAELLGRLDELTAELAGQLPENAGGGWGDQDYAADDARVEEVLAQARATREHMRGWAAGTETHRGEDDGRA